MTTQEINALLKVGKDLRAAFDRIAVAASELAPVIEQSYKGYYQELALRDLDRWLAKQKRDDGAV